MTIKQTKDLKSKSASPETVQDPTHEKESTPSWDLNSVKSQAADLSIQDVAPDEAKPVTRLAEESVRQIVEKVAVDLQVDPAAALVAIYLLLLKGAANVKAPNNMEVLVQSPNKGQVSLSKLDLTAAYKRVTGNNFLRRLAETLACDISSYAEKNNLRGELATRINNKLLSANQPPLDTKEMAWASSFCQNVPNLSQLSSQRIPNLLAEDYNSRFSGKTKGSNQPKSQPARKGQKKRANKNKTSPSSTQ